MTADQFCQLSDREQDLALQQGTFLAQREAGEHRYYLYSLCNFYVELGGITQSPFISGYRAFADLDDLEPYLAQIKINM
ncbi:MAG TPA: hypothetical protein VF610_05775 [Segetibacter sp.]|jgi:hypothetical protein